MPNRRGKCIENSLIDSVDRIILAEKTPWSKSGRQVQEQAVQDEEPAARVQHAPPQLLTLLGGVPGDAFQVRFNVAPVQYRSEWAGF